VDYGEVIERLSSMVGEHVEVSVWTDRGKSNLIARLRGHLERFDRDAVWATHRARLIKEMQAQGLSRAYAEREVRDLENGMRRAERALERGEPMPGEWYTAVAVNVETGRLEHFSLRRGGQGGSDLTIRESDLQSADYDRDGLTLHLSDVTLTFMGIYRPKRRRK
jgi:hypothetical protein